jgi:GDPmannose 4,6-dehydratase
MVSAVAVVNTLEAMLKVSRKTRFFQAGSSEMFGDSVHSPQNEESSFAPRNVYGSAKVFAHHITMNYRENTGLFAATGILYNHESPLRAPQFVTRKISSSVAQISLGLEQELNLGNLSAIRDWGYAPEYVAGMKQILEHSEPDTFVLATGRGASVREFVRLAFQVIGVEVKFEGDGLEERGFDERTGRTLVSVDPKYFRPDEEVPLIGDASKAKKLLGWEAKTQLNEIVRLMVESDIKNLANRNA